MPWHMLGRGVPPRVLILTASVGEGHDAPTRTLSAQLRRECPEVDVLVEDGLQHMGGAVRHASETAPRVVFLRGGWIWDAAYWVFAVLPPGRRLAQESLVRFGGASGMLRLVLATSPDVIVSLYPQTTEVLGRLRGSGRIAAPLVAGITDVAALAYWATPGADVHLITHPESEAEVREVAGASADVRCVHGFTSEAFLQPRSRTDAREALGLPRDGHVVIVSGGGWGVGAVEEAVATAIALDDVALVACLCGRNERLLGRLQSRFGGIPRLRLEGFTDEMPDWLAAADTLIHSTGGLTMLEAQMRGCPAVSYGWGRGHVRLQDKAYRRFGLAQVASTPAELSRCLERALSNPRVVPFDFAALPSAASVVLELARKPT